MQREVHTLTEEKSMPPERSDDENVRRITESVN